MRSVRNLPNVPVKKKFQVGVFAHLEKCRALRASESTHSETHVCKAPGEQASGNKRFLMFSSWYAPYELKLGLPPITTILVAVLAVILVMILVTIFIVSLS